MHTSPSFYVEEYVLQSTIGNHSLDTMDYMLKQKYSHVLIMGNFNYPEITWNMDISTTTADQPSQVFMTPYRDWFSHQR